MHLTQNSRRAITQLIMDDLMISPTTASSVAGRIGIDLPTIEKILSELHDDDLVSCRTIKESLTVYSITSIGTDFRNSIYDQPIPE